MSKSTDLREENNRLLADRRFSVVLGEDEDVDHVSAHYVPDAISALQMQGDEE
jgi:hypothetical protein